VPSDEPASFFVTILAFRRQMQHITLPFHRYEI